jgi:hypothetical protein
MKTNKFLQVLTTQRNGRQRMQRRIKNGTFVMEANQNTTNINGKKTLPTENY